MSVGTREASESEVGTIFYGQEQPKYEQHKANKLAAGLGWVMYLDVSNGRVYECSTRFS